MRAEQKLLVLIGELMGLLDIDEFSQGLLEALRETVPAEWCALNELPPGPHAISLTEPPVPLDMHAAFARFGHQNPLVEHYLRGRDGRAIRFSDVISSRELHALELYRQVYRPLGVEYQIAFMLPSSPQRVLGVALSRCHRDFDTEERDLLNLARPYLIQGYRNALAHSRMLAPARQVATADLRALGLTPRQVEILRLVAMGHSGASAAATLSISLRTAQKHLQSAYRTLGVHSRADAALRVWEAS
jgi:DNA-binding CsgD family transcriptional regulator